MNDNEIHTKASAMLEGFGYFLCDHFNARMSIESCLKRQRDKDCATSNECTKGIDLGKEHPKLNKKVLSDSPLPPSIYGRGFGKRKPPKEKSHCSYRDCTNSCLARKLCKVHYSKWRNGALEGYPAFTHKSDVKEKLNIELKEIKMGTDTADEEKKTPLELIPVEKKSENLSVDGVCEYCNTPIEFKNPDCKVHHIFELRNNPPLNNKTLTLNLLPLNNLFEDLEADAKQNMRTTKQQAIYYIREAVNLSKKESNTD